ncbi:Hypothetical_protein [Hexamita inflata]|uniref:Hypothetical_protein n=1 Tax=Hexamita inflata TaxID=28002 RepID=A0AA86PFK1_9EUKA|nr:Hypothetical protein HINF_LOCUS24098 [Hexamita inflata]
MPLKRKLYKLKPSNLYTIYEDSEEYSLQTITRENSCDDIENNLEIADQQELQNECQLKTLIQLTAFETQNIRKRVTQLIFSYDNMQQNISMIQQSQLSILNSIISQISK